MKQCCMLLLKFCILFGNVSIETGEYFFDCSGKVSLNQIRRGKSSTCGGFGGDGNVLTGDGACVYVA